MRSEALLGASLALSGCFATAPIGQQPVPAEFLAACKAAERAIVTNSDLAKALRDHKAALAECNLDKEAIRQWSDGLTAP